MVTGGLRDWTDVRENGKEDLVREFENYENGMERIISTRSEEFI